ncbi:MAG TPA: alkaline phosphatase family protein, partial [Polyangiaceae bacterium]
GRAGLMAHTLPKKTKAGHIPFKKIAEFYADCKNGTLPSVSYIEPDYHTNCDHPVKDIRLGQAFVQHVYKRLAASPQWKKTVLFVLYDEHGGFWDHVPPPKAEDAHADFRRFGFRVPAFAAGGIVKRGYLGQAHHDHTSILATIAERFGLKSLSKRQENATPITAIFDAKIARKSIATAPIEPEPMVLDAEALESVGTTSQEELEATIDAAEIPAEYTDDRPLTARLADWLIDAQEVGAVKLAQ